MFPSSFIDIFSHTLYFLHWNKKVLSHTNQIWFSFAPSPALKIEEPSSPYFYPQKRWHKSHANYYTKYCIECHQFYLSCSILIVNCPCGVTNTKCKPNIICHSLYKNSGITDFNVAITNHLLNDFSSKFQCSMTIFHCINARMQNIPNFVSINGMDFMHYATIEWASKRRHRSAQ